MGRKTAERLILELRDRLPKLEIPSKAEAPSGDEQSSKRAEALAALSSLGYARAVAEKAIRIVLSEARGTELTLEELIKRALRHTGK